jgi:hypothetical protein
LAVTLRFSVQYPDDYPEVLPEMDLEPIEGEWENDEYNELLGDLKLVVRRVQCCAVLTHPTEADAHRTALPPQAQESIGMAMVFTLATHLREATSALVARRVVDKQRAADEKHQREEDVRPTHPAVAKGLVELTHTPVLSPRHWPSE